MRLSNPCLLTVFFDIVIQGDTIRDELYCHDGMRLKAKRDMQEDTRMLVCDYIVEQIDGDYAHLKRVDMPEEDLKLVARALLPTEITEGSKLHYELMQYSLITE